MGENAEDEWGGYLVWSVGYTDVEIGQLCFDEVADDDVQFPLFRFSLDTFRDFCSHSGIHFYSGNMFCFFENFDGEIASTGTNFEDFIRRTEVCFIYDGLCDLRIFQDVLTKSLRIENGVVNAGGATALCIVMVP